MASPDLLEKETEIPGADRCLETKQPDNAPGSDSACRPVPRTPRMAKEACGKLQSSNNGETLQSTNLQYAVKRAIIAAYIDVASLDCVQTAGVGEI